MYWSQVDPSERQRDIVRQLAYLCRYAKGVTLTELLHCGRDFLLEFEKAITEIVERENRPND
jgi:hypothetical protein